MGCDIHSILEHQIGNKWHAVYRTIDQKRDAFDIKWPPCISDGYTSKQVKKYKEGFLQASYSHRNYHLFGMLAGVRGDCNPMPSHAGRPTNASSDYQALCKRYGCDGHSHHYLSLDQILAYNFNQTCRCTETFTRSGLLAYLESGVFDEKHLAPYRETKLQFSFSEVTQHERLLHYAQIKALPARCHIRAEIPLPYSYFAGDFYSDYIPFMKTIDPDPAKVRFCFFFDN